MLYAKNIFTSPTEKWGRARSTSKDYYSDTNKVNGRKDPVS